MSGSTSSSIRLAVLAMTTIAAGFAVSDASARDASTRLPAARAAEDARPSPHRVRYYRYLDQPDVYWGEDGTVTRAGDAPVAFEPTNLAGPEQVGRVFDPYAHSMAQRSWGAGAPAMPARPVARAIEASAKGYVVQVGAFAAYENAARARLAANEAGAAVIRTEAGARGALHRVQLGPFETRAEADRARENLLGVGITGALIARAG